ncbi:MAG: hypothetical protein ACPG7F_07970 [Aggregatilineales bacterium]
MTDKNEISYKDFEYEAKSHIEGRAFRYESNIAERAWIIAKKRYDSSSDKHKIELTVAVAGAVGILLLSGSIISRQLKS